MTLTYGPTGSMSYQMWDTSDPDTILIDYELTDEEMGEDGSLKFGNYR